MQTVLPLADARSLASDLDSLYVFIKATFLESSRYSWLHELQLFRVALLIKKIVSCMKDVF